MNPNVEIVLRQAYDLIEAGQLDNAKALLKPVLETEKDNPDIWWLYAHSVTDKETARLALNNVLRIDGTYPDARELLEQLADSGSYRQQFTDEELEKEPPFIPAFPSSLPGLSTPDARRDVVSAISSDDIDDDILDDFLSDDQPDAFYRRPLFYVPLVILLLLGALAIVLLRPFATNAPLVPATSEAALITITAPTSEISPTALDQTTVPLAVDATGSPDVLSASDITSLTSELSQFSVSSSNFATINTSLGNSLVVSVCTTSGRELRELLPQVMSVLAKSSDVYVSKVDGIGVRMLDCNSNEVLRWIGSPIGDAISYTEGNLSESDFQARWTPVTEQ